MKKLLYVLLGIIVLYLILALAGPKKITVARQINIGRSAAAVKYHLSDLKSFHDNWSPWTEKDTAMATTYSGEPGQVGHSYTWSGNKEVGTGTMSIRSISQDTIYQIISFSGEGDSDLFLSAVENGDSTKVTWSMTFGVEFLRRPFMIFLPMDKWLGADFEKGLNMLKHTVELMPSETVSYSIEEQQWESTTFVGKKETLLLSDMNAFFSKNYGDLMSDKSVRAVSPPSAIYYEFDEAGGKASVAACVKVADASSVKKWETFNLPACKVLKAAYYGSYEKIGTVHAAMAEYMKTRSLKGEIAIEEYVSDPELEKDTTKWLTNVYYILE